MQYLGYNPDLDLDRHQNGKSELNPDRHQNQADPRHCVSQWIMKAFKSNSYGLGKFFCTGCHEDKTAIIPAKGDQSTIEAV